MKPLRPRMFLQLLLVCSILFFHVQAQIHHCLHTFECPADKRCSVRRVSQVDGECGNEDCGPLPNRCVPKLGLFESCSESPGDCRAGLYCSPAVPLGRYPPVCTPKKKLGESCIPTDIRPCENDPKVRCNGVTKRCEKFTGGRLNDKCRVFTDCRHEEGFFCSFPSKKCAPRKPDGAECGHVYYECSGFCAPQGTPRGYRRVCTSQVQQGEVCRGDASCAGNVRGRHDLDDVRCNSKWNRLGVCVRRSKKLRKAGALCDSKNDRCDRDRNLYCKKFRNVHRCLQKSSSGNTCTPGSKYSSCDELEAGAPMECRQQLSLTKKKPFGMATCQRKPKIVRRGEICNRKEFARCERGTKCRTVAGIEAFDGEDPKPPLAYCVKLVKVGKKCRNRFMTGCVKGSYCIKGKCRKRKKAPRVFFKYAGDGVVCWAPRNIISKAVKKRCARGLTCPKSNRWRVSRCGLKLVKVPPGQPCYDLPNKYPICTAGYVCIRDLKRDGHKRCLKRGLLHDYCFGFTCAKGLKCRPLWTKNAFSELTCYNPKTVLPVGANCTVSKKNKSHNCGLIEIDSADSPLKCMSVPGRKGRKKCILQNEIFKYCNESDNIFCSSGLTCNRFNTCIISN